MITEPVKDYQATPALLPPTIKKNDKLAKSLIWIFSLVIFFTITVLGRVKIDATFFSDNRLDLEKLQTPTLILQCSDDIIAPLTVGEYLESHLQNSTLKVMKAKGHCPHMSEPEETIGLIKEYLGVTA